MVHRGRRVTAAEREAAGHTALQAGSRKHALVLMYHVLFLLFHLGLHLWMEHLIGKFSLFLSRAVVGYVSIKACMYTYTQTHTHTSKPFLIQHVRHSGS